MSLAAQGERGRAALREKNWGGAPRAGWESLGAAGWALLAWTLGRDLCSLLLQSAAARWAAPLLEEPTFFRVVSLLSCYGVGLPLAAWCMKRVPAAPNREKSGIGAGVFLLGFPALLGLMYGANLITLTVQALLGLGGGGEAADTGPVALVALQTVILAPVAEEWLFRGLMLGRLLPLGERKAVAVSALCFALSHGSGEQLLYALAGGAVLGYLAVRTGRIWPGMLLHAVANAVALVLPRVGGTVETVVALALVPLGLLCAAYLWRQRPLLAGGPNCAGAWRQGGMPLALLYALLRMTLG